MYGMELLLFDLSCVHFERSVSYLVVGVFGCTVGFLF